MLLNFSCIFYILVSHFHHIFFHLNLMHMMEKGMMRCYYSTEFEYDNHDHRHREDIILEFGGERM